MLKTHKSLYNKPDGVFDTHSLSPGEHTIVVHAKDGSGFFKRLQHDNPNFTTAEPVTIVDMSKPLSPELRTAAEGFFSASRKAGIIRIFYGYGEIEPYLKLVLWPKTSFVLTAGQEE